MRNTDDRDTSPEDSQEVYVCFMPIELTGLGKVYEQYNIYLMGDGGF